MKDRDNKEVQVSDKSSMVDVGLKAVTRREALAECYIHFPEAVFSELKKNGFLTHKGSIISTSTVAGLMGVKKTPDILPKQKWGGRVGGCQAFFLRPSIRLL